MSASLTTGARRNPSRRFASPAAASLDGCARGSTLRHLLHPGGTSVWKRTRRRLSVVSLVVICSIAASPGPVAFAGPCGDTGNYFDGFYYDPVPSGHVMRGSRATITARASTQCSGTTNFSTSWTMWEGGNDGQHYVQAGFMKITSHGYTEAFSEFNNGTGFTRYYRGVQVTDGTTAQFQTIYDFNSSAGCPVTAHCAYTYYGLNRLQRTTFDPTTWSSPYYNEVFGETSNIEANIPGTPTTPTSFTGISFFDGNQVLISQPCGMSTRLSIPSRWAQDSPACDQRRVWTK